jgi:hypothetical protein
MCLPCAARASAIFDAFAVVATEIPLAPKSMLSNSPAAAGKTVALFSLKDPSDCENF